MDILNETKKKDTTIKGKLNSSFSAVTLPSYSEPSYDESVSGRGYIEWGRRNDFPEYLWSVYRRCSTLQSIINGYADYTAGSEIINNSPFTGENPVGDTIEDVIKRIILDLWVYGGYALQVFYNQFGVPIYTAYIDISKVRINREYTKAYLIDDFQSFKNGRHTRNILEFDLFGCLSVEERAIKGSEILFYKGQKTKGYYPVCDYISALISAEIQIEIKKYHFNNISNGMLSGTVINFNNAENVADEVKEQIEAGIKSKFTGSGGAGELIIAWNEDKDHEITISKLEDDNFDSKFTSLAESTRDDLFISMRAQPVLFGLNVQTGFNEQEFNEAFNLANKTTILPKQNEIVRCFNRIFNMGSYSGMDRVPDAIEIKPFSLTNTLIIDRNA